MNSTITFIRDLYGHQAWADAEQWRAFENLPGTQPDKEIFDRFKHFHFTQSAFLAIVRRESVDVFKDLQHLQESSSEDELKQFAIRNHAEASKFLQECSPATLEETVSIPWFNDPPLTLTIAHALTQAAMHSQYHRGQNASRIRALGGTPPTTDFISWIWKARPKPEWT